jgi:hypothetical protein
VPIIDKCTYGAVGLPKYLTRKHNQIEYANILNLPWNVGNLSWTLASNSLGKRKKKALVSICHNRVNQGSGIGRNGLEIIYWG